MPLTRVKFNQLQVRATLYIYYEIKYQLITMRHGGDKIWYHCKSESKLHLSFTYAGNKLCLHKKKKITDF